MRQSFIVFIFVLACLQFSPAMGTMYLKKTGANGTICLKEIEEVDFKERYSNGDESKEFDFTKIQHGIEQNKNLVYMITEELCIKISPEGRIIYLKQITEQQFDAEAKKERKKVLPEAPDQQDMSRGQPDHRPGCCSYCCGHYCGYDDCSGFCEALGGLLGQA